MVEHTIPLANKLLVGGCIFALQTLGIDAGPVFWALVGAALGMTFAAPTTRLRAGVIFVSVVLTCSLFGTWLAQRYFTDLAINRNACACALAIAFHPLLQAAVTRLPRVIDNLLRRFGLGDAQ